MSGVGHNSASYGEEIDSEPVTTVLDDDHRKLFYYVKWHLSDYITGTQGMTVEQEGIYIRFLTRLYDRGKPFPDDDRFMVVVLGLSTVRVWKRFRESLLTIGKIISRNGCLTNARFERERQTRADELRKQAESARKRWAAERERKKVSAKLGANLAETSSKLSANIDKKINENNEIRLTPHMPPRDERLEKKEESSNQGPLAHKANGSLVPSSSAPDAAGETKKKDAAASRLDGATDVLPIQDGEVLEGPGFRLDLKAAELELQMACIPTALTRNIAEAVTRDWIANKFKPRSPIAAFRTALATRKNAEVIDKVRLSTNIIRATQSPQSAQINATYERVMAKKQAREAAND